MIQSSGVKPVARKWASLLKASRSRSSRMTTNLKQSVKEKLWAMFLTKKRFVFSPGFDSHRHIWPSFHF